MKFFCFIPPSLGAMLDGLFMQRIRKYTMCNHWHTNACRLKLNYKPAQYISHYLDETEDSFVPVPLLNKNYFYLPKHTKSGH